jgi:hypothetical protein
MDFRLDKGIGEGIHQIEIMGDRKRIHHFSYWNLSVAKRGWKMDWKQ